jgi:hypothetical protein
MSRDKGRSKLTLDIQNMLIQLSYISLSDIERSKINYKSCLTYYKSNYCENIYVSLMVLLVI